MTGGLNVALKNMMNAMYSHALSGKVRSAMTTRAKNGEYLAATTLYGYVEAPEDRPHLVIDEEAAKVVREIFGLVRRRASQGMNCRLPQRPKFNGLWDKSFVSHLNKYESKFNDRREELPSTIWVKAHVRFRCDASQKQPQILQPSGEPTRPNSRTTDKTANLSCLRFHLEPYL